jgi:hypothetical protein
MILELIRQHFTPASTIGSLSINGVFECYILEDVCREPEPGLWRPELKIATKTAIPYGSFAVSITESERFKRRLPLLLNVPSFSGVRIHPGNDALATDGCLLTGQTQSTDYVGNSRLAFEALFAKLDAAFGREPIKINIFKGVGMHEQPAGTGGVA